MPRPRSDKPYICGPYKHRNKWRVIIYTPRPGGGRDRTMESRDTEQSAKALKRDLESLRAAAGRTVGDAVAEYITYLGKRGNKSGSIKTAGYRLAAILDKSKALIDLTPRRASELYDRLVAEGGAVDTHQGCLIAAKAFGRFVSKQKWMKVNPFEEIETQGRKSRGKKQLTIDQANKLKEYCYATWATKGDRSVIAALLPLEMGLRASEVSQLEAEHVDHEGKLLHVGETDSKTAAGRRLLNTKARLIGPMRELAAEPATSKGHLFAKPDGSPADRHWVHRVATRHMKAAGIVPVTTHGLRGTFATMATVSNDQNLPKQMGHTSASMTESTYIDPVASANAKIARASVFDKRKTDEE